MKKTCIYGFAGIRLILAMIITISCSDKEIMKRSEGITTEIHIERFEKELFSIDPALVEDSLPGWEKRHGEFFRNFCWVAGLGNTSDSGFAGRLSAFITDRQNYRLYKRTMEVFPNLNEVTREFNVGFSNYLRYFPGMAVPEIYTYIAGISQSAITDEGLLAIGLDRYLGTNEPLYLEAGIFKYLTSNMHPGKIASDCMNFWAETEFTFNDSVNSLIAHIIFRGRLLYFTKAMLPDQPDSLTLGFSTKDLRYLQASEKSMWAFLVEHKLLFNSDRFTINKFIQEGPFTTDFGRESPARAAVWIGYRITEAYMKRNHEADLSDLMQERDYLSILNGSGYNP